MAEVFAEGVDGGVRGPVLLVLGAMGGGALAVLGDASLGVVGSAFCRGIVLLKVRARIGRRKGGGSRVMGVRSSRTERRRERLIFCVSLFSLFFFI